MSTAIDTVEEETTPATEKPLGKRKLLLIVAAATMLVLVLLAVVLWFTGVVPHRKQASALPQQAGLVEKSVLIDVPDIVTNLDSGSRRAVFVRLKAKIEVAHVGDQAIIATDMPRILDAFQTYLRSMRPEELHGGEGTYRLREALMNRIDVIAAPVQVLDVLFVEMLIQ